MFFREIAALRVVAFLAALSCSPFAFGSDEEQPGFVELFDGESLNGWRGDEPYWSVRDGCIVGEITEETLIDRNRFLIYQGDMPHDFELRVEFRISARGNSGVNYRSKVVPGIDFHALAGYQFDFDGRMRYVGSNYEERRRTTLARVGESVVVQDPAVGGDAGRVEGNAWTGREVVEMFGDPDELRKTLRHEDWNKGRIIAKGPTIEHYVNGVLISRVVDNDTKNRRLSGKLGVQVHTGPPMTVEYRSIRVRALED